MNQRIGRRPALRAKHVAVAVAAAFAPWAHSQTPPLPNTLPSGGMITHGSGMIHAPAGSTLQIDQSSPHMAARFTSFSIGQSAHVNVTQPLRSSVALFKDVGGSLSQIYGGLTANGQIFISNQNGVLFGSTARVEVGSLFATNLSINETDFMDGRYNWYNDGATGTVTNQGTIITPSGYTVLAGPQVRNDGLIIARTGTVALAAGDRVALDLIGDGLISVNVDQAALNASAVNTGTIFADGGTVMLTARSANALLDTVINTSGVIRAMSLAERNGEIILSAGPNGGMIASGEVQASGEVSISGGSFQLQRLVPDPMLLNGLMAGGELNVDLTGAMTVEGGQIHTQSGQSISAGSLTVRAQDGGFATLNNQAGNQVITVVGAEGMRLEGLNGGGVAVTNQSGNQTITVTGAGGIHVEASNGAGTFGSAILGKPFFFGAPATDSQTISAARIQVRGGSIQANEQNIAVSGDVSLHNGGVSTLGGNQTITVTGGNVDMRGASISSGAAQSITVTGGDHISVVGEAGFAGLQASFGPQTVSITGTGANAINIDGATVNGLNQTITAGNTGESGSITLTGSSHSNGFSHIANIGVGVANPQTVRTSGTLTITGGSARAAGIFQNNPAEQRISAASVVLQGGPSGSGNGAFINSTFGGGQLFTVPGEIRLTGGTGGTANRAGIVTNGNQTINGNPNLVMTGGSGGVEGAGNNVFINANGGDTKPQTINAGTILLSAGAGADASATLLAARQIITTTGDVSLLGSAGSGALNGVRIGGMAGATPGATNLTLVAGGDLLLRGGAANGAGLGTSANSAGSNTITVTALAGDVVLESGTGAGARIGTSAMAPVVGTGSITVTAGGTLDLDDGTGIRANGPITLTANSLTNDGTISNGGGTNTANMILNANAFDLDGGIIQGGAAAVILRPRDGTRAFGIEALAAGTPGVTTLTNADIASIDTSNFVVFGSGIGSTFTGNMTIGENARVEGGGKNLAFFRSTNPGPGTTTVGSQGVSTSGDLIVSAGSGSIVSGGGIVAGDEVQLRATLGIGAAGASVRTDTNALTIVNSTFGVPPFFGGNAFVSEANDVTLRNTTLNVGGMMNSANNFVSGSLDFSAGGNVTVAGTVQSIGAMNVNANGSLTLGASGTQDAILRGDNGGQTISAQSVSITARDGRLAQILNSGGNQEVTASTIDIRTQAGGGTAEIRNSTVGEQTINAAGGSITLRGADSGIGRASIFSGGNQTINGNPDLFLTGGGIGVAGAGNDARIDTALGSARQTINAGSIVLSNSAFANSNTFAGFNSSHQVIATTGDVILSSGTGAHPGVVRIQGGNAATDLQLNLGGSLRLTGGNAPGGGVGLGSSNVSNNISVVAAGDVILNSGVNGARIGSSSDGTVGGNISISGRSIQLNGTNSTAAIRTLDSVTLHADQPGGTISQSGNGLIIAGSLVTTSPGSTSLTGPNQVSMFNGTASGGDLTLNNSGALTVTGLSASTTALTNAGDVTVSGPWNSSIASITTTGAGSDLTVNSAVTSSGAMSVNVAGAITVSAGAGQQAMLRSFGGQMISGRSLSVTSNGGSASVWNTGPSAQTINVSDGAGVDVQTLASGGFAQISADAGGNQTINVLNGDHINVNGAKGLAGVFNSGGTQTLSISGSGRNAITVGSTGALGGSNVGGGFTQSVTAGLAGQQGSITIVGADAQSALAGFVSNPNVGGTQTISTSGTISVTGGRAAPQFGNFPTGIFHNGTGQQTINAGRIELTGGPTGSNNAALINVPGGNVPANAAAQVVNVSGDIVIAGGVGGNAGILGSAARQQTVNAANISLTNSAGGGTNSVGFIQGGHQQITASGDVLLQARASGGDLPGVRIGGLAGNNPTATDLTLNVGRDLILQGSTTTVNNGVGIGSTAAAGAPPLRNDITINAGRDVTLNSGVATSGARIGSPQAGVAEGSINITAGGNINLNGVSESASIRTLGTATLRAANITEAAQGRIIAGTLSTNTSGRTLLTGPNEVANFSGSSVSDVTLNNTGALNVTSMNAGTATLTNSGDVTLTGIWNSFAATSITTTGPGSDLKVNSFVQSNGPMMLNVDGAVRVAASGVQDASLTAFGGQSINARSVEITSLDGRFASIGNNISGDQTITVSGGGVEIDSISGNGFAFITNSGTGGQLIGVSDGSGIHVRTSSGSGSGQINNFGTGNQTINVSAGGGVDVRTLSGTGFALISNAGAGNQAISVTGGTGIDVVSGGGFASIGQNALGLSQTITATNADHINVNGVGGNAGISASGPQTLSITGSGANAITVGSSGGRGSSSVGGSGQTIAAGAIGEQGSITVIGADAPDRFVGISSFTAQGTPPRGQSITTAGTIAVIGGNAAGQFIPPLPRPQVVTTSNAGIFNNSNAQQTISAGGIVIRGGASGLNNGAFISSNAGGDQYLTVPGAILITGGAGGDNNRALILGSGNQTISGNPHIALTGGSGSEEIGNNGAFIIANAPGKTQTIRAADITVSSGGGGINNGAGITGTKQFITTTGDVIMSGAASTGQFSGTRIGGLGGNTTGPTDLTMDIGGSLLMTGGTAEFNGASIGSTLSSPAHPNSITITAQGDVVLNPGTAAGARIGSSTASDEVALGGISITAGGKIELNGNSTATPTAIRTLGHVTLSAGTTISEGSHGRVEAGSLTTTSTGMTSLTGPNQVASFNATSTGGDVSLSNTGLLDVTGMSAFGDATINNIGDVTVSGPWNAGGTSTITVGSDIVLSSAMVSKHVVLTANDGAIIQAETASIAAETLTTSSTGDTLLDGLNEVAMFNASSTEGGISVRTSSPVLALASMELPGELLIRHTGAVDVRGNVSALAHDISATGNVTVGGADAQSATSLYATGDISISTAGSIIVRGSDTTAGASSAVLAGGELNFSAGNVALIGGSAPGSVAQVKSHGAIDISAGGNVSLVGGSGDGAFARILGYSDINLTLGGFITLGAGTGAGSWARVQTASRDSVITLNFPNLASGGYFVNGIEGLLRDGHTGFLSGSGVAAPGHQLITIYGAP